MASAQDTAMGTNRSPKHEDWEAPGVLIQLLEPTDVRFNGSRPWDIQVRDPVL